MDIFEDFSLDIKNSKLTSPKKMITADTENDPFKEIQIYEKFDNSSSSSITIPNNDTVLKDSFFENTRILFYNMRQAAKNDGSFFSNHNRIFYKQAVIMENFEDDYDKYEGFSSYYPYYDFMTYSQLRSYFSWRSQVRKGNIQKTDLSYAYLYIYELLNNIGVSSYQDGADKLFFFWQNFRSFDSTVDRYIIGWLKDYYVYYPLNKTFREFVLENNMQTFYPSVFGYYSDKNDSFDIFSSISKYKIKKSVFYNDDSKKIINDCFNYILSSFRNMFEGKNMCFEDMIFFKLESESPWMPFGKALFYPVILQPDRKVEISKNEIYTCLGGKFTFTSVIISDKGRRLIDYILKEMESSLRNIMNFKKKINVSPEMCDLETIKILNKIGIVLPDFIRKCTGEYYSLATRKEVTVNISSVKQIRDEAMITTEKLIVPENDYSIDKAFLSENKNVPINENGLFNLKNNIEIDSNPKKLSENYENDIWTCFINALDNTEYEALKIILLEKNFNEFALKNNQLAEVLIDNINQKAADFIGDTVIELDEKAFIYDEYRENLAKAVKI